MSDRVDDTASRPAAWRLAIAAIDFGTTYSGYAVSFTGDDAVYVNKDWGSKSRYIVYSSFNNKCISIYKLYHG